MIIIRERPSMHNERYHRDKDIFLANKFFYEVILIINRKITLNGDSLIIYMKYTI